MAEKRKTNIFEKEDYIVEKILRLNDTDVVRNPAVWSHDPSMMWDPVRGKYYSYSTDVYRPESGLLEKRGIPVRSSEDLVHFKYEGTVLSEKAVREGMDNGDYPETENFWAPFTEYVKGEYRMYYSATKAFGSSESRIWLAVSDDPLGPFENRGVVVDTWGTDDTYPNGIDPHIVHDEEKCWLVYGSFFGGIYIKELDPATGLPADRDPRSLGICISRKAPDAAIDGPEGGAVIYVPETGYYYLFQSYGWLGDDYDIRVGRSRRVTGPYLDMKGQDLKEKSMGVKLAGSYCFCSSDPKVGRKENGWKWGGIRGPGHGVPFYDPASERYFFVHHFRDGASVNRVYDREMHRASYQVHYMMVRPMFFINGWPVFGPEPYQGEKFEPLSPDEVGGWGESLVFDDRDNRIQFSRKESVQRENLHPEECIIYRCPDFENGGETAVITGINNSGLAYWKKFMYSIV